MIGAIIGDIAGSTYEFHSHKAKDFPLFAPGSSYTDDSLMSIAVASALMQTGESHDGFKSHAVTSMRQIATKYPCPMGGYGGASGTGWFRQIPAPTAALGTAPRCAVSPCGDVAATLDEALALAKQSAEVTHSHPEGIKGAQAGGGSHLSGAHWGKQERHPQLHRAALLALVSFPYGAYDEHPAALETRFVKGILFSKIQFQNHYMNESVLFRV